MGALLNIEGLVCTSYSSDCNNLYYDVSIIIEYNN